MVDVSLATDFSELHFDQIHIICVRLMILMFECAALKPWGVFGRWVIEVGGPLVHLKVGWEHVRPKLG